MALSIKLASNSLNNNASPRTHTPCFGSSKHNSIEGSHQLNHLDLRQLVPNVCIEWVPAALEKKIELCFDDPKQGVWVRGDALLLSELLAILGVISIISSLLLLFMKALTTNDCFVCSRIQKKLFCLI
jgi:hypothetical protein